MTPTIRDLLINSESGEASEIFKALGHPLCLKILNYLSNRAHTVIQISEILNIPMTTLNQHIKVLENAGLIQTDLRPASRGTEKVCSGIYSKLVYNLASSQEHLEHTIEYAMPVGAYSDFQILRPCGLADENEIIGQLGDPDAFLEPDHIYAKALWFGAGYVEYRFPKRLPPGTHPVRVSLSMEICSEAQGTNNDYPSDITVWINSCEIGTWTSPGDFSDRRGLLNPEWWKLSQYGHLKTWVVDEKGSSIDQQTCSSVKLADLKISSNPFILVRIGIKPDAIHPGGVNLFGSAFGDHPQDLLLRIVYDKPSNPK